jgi:hypothetical protein
MIEIPAPTRAERRLLAAADPALKRVREVRFEDWRALGCVLVFGRNLCMRLTNSPSPYGSRYQTAYARWLKERNLYDCIPPSTRAYLVEMTLNIHRIEAWRAALTESQRAQWQSPHVVLEHWQKSLPSEQRRPRRPKRKASKPEPKPQPQPAEPVPMEEPQPQPEPAEASVVVQFGARPSLAKLFTGACPEDIARTLLHESGVSLQLQLRVACAWIHLIERQGIGAAA